MKVATQKTFSSSSQLKHQLAKAEKLKVIFLSYKSQVAPGVVSETLASSVRGKCICWVGAGCYPVTFTKMVLHQIPPCDCFWSLADWLTSLLAYFSGALPVNSQWLPVATFKQHLDPSPAPFFSFSTANICTYAWRLPDGHRPVWLGPQQVHVF